MGNFRNVHPYSHGSVAAEHNGLATLVNSIPAQVAYIDCNMVLGYCNQSFREWFSLDGNVAGKSFPVVAGKEIFNQLQRHMGRVLVGERAHFQMIVETSTGPQYLDATLSPDFDDRKRVKGFIFHSSDVTEQNRTERALKDYFENASIGLHWLNSDGVIIWANPSELSMLGYAEDEYVGHHISEFHADKNAVTDILQRVRNKPRIKNYEAELICKNGSIKHVTINSAGLWEGDKLVHTRFFTVDITEQKLSALAVKKSEERFKMMANLIPLIIWTTDEKGLCNFLNSRWEELTGKKAEEVLGKYLDGFIHADDRKNITQSWIQSFSSKKSFEAKFRIMNATGAYSVAYANSRPWYTATGEFAGYIGILHDISSDEHVKTSLERIVLDRTEDLRNRNAELKLAERALQEKNTELEEINNELSSFAHIASHDLQEPLRKIEIFLNRLLDLEGKNLSSKGIDLFSRIQESSERMRNLIQDLLTYSKSSSSEGRSENIDLNVLLGEVLNELDIKIHEKRATIENTGLPHVNVIRFQFHQLFLNLLSNALKFTRPESPPRVLLGSELLKGDHLPDFLAGDKRAYHHISIADNGVGFEPQYAEKIFEMFHRLHVRSKYEGTGIGLAICKKIVENHGGMIIAEGRINKGATFHIYLPATGH